MKKPLNAFLGEVFEAEWDGADGVTKLVSEQVGHHPPITACRLWNETAGVEVSFPLVELEGDVLLRKWSG